MLLLGLFGCGKPRVEEVTYTDYSNRYLNALTIVVNTGRPYQGKTGILGGYERCRYLFSMTIKSNTYTANDMEVRVSPTDQDFRPKSGLVKITQKDVQSIVIDVSIDDARIPKLVNGTYALRSAEATPDHVWYKTK
jgi:hypothetical protein